MEKWKGTECGIERAGKTKIIRLNSLNPVTFAIRQLYNQHKFLTLPEWKQFL